MGILVFQSKKPTHSQNSLILIQLVQGKSRKVTE